MNLPLTESVGLTDNEAVSSPGDRLQTVLDMVRRLSEAKTPNEVLVPFAEGLRQMQKPRTYISVSTRGLKPGEYRITRVVPAELTDWSTVPNPWQLGDRMPVHRSGILSRIVRTREPYLNNDIDLSADPVLAEYVGHMRTMVALPLFDDGQALNWAVSFLPAPNAVAPDELADRLLQGNLVGGTVRHVLTAQKLREANEAIQNEVQRIASIQKSLLPRKLPTIPGLSIGASYETYDQAGGDMYDFLPLAEVVDDDAAAGDPRWAILIGDASGHGPAAAVVMAMVHAIMHAYPRMPSGPGEMLGYLNRHLSRKRIDASFVTAFLAFYCPQTHTLTYARAGHNPPVLKPPPGSDEPMRELSDVGGLPLGVLPEQSYDEASLTLEPNYSLVLYTDGITEARNDHGDQFGIEGIEQSLTDCSGEPQCAIGHVTKSLRNHEAGSRPRDDQTLLAIQREP